MTWTPVIVTHAAVAFISVVLGGLLLSGRKGTGLHRLGGWIWVICMVYVAGVSFIIKGPSGFSWIHGLSVWTLFSLVFGVWFARTKKIKFHRSTMISIYFLALVVTGLFTLLPGRLLGKAVWTWWGLT